MLAAAATLALTSLGLQAFAQGMPQNIPRKETLILENPEGTIENAGWFNIWAINAGSQSNGLQQAALDTLWYIDPEAELDGVWDNSLAAEKPIYSADFTEMTVKLRRGIHCSDGVEFTAADLVYTVETQIKYPSMRWSAALALTVASIETPDPTIGKQIAKMLRPSMGAQIPSDAKEIAHVAKSFGRGGLLGAKSIQAVDDVSFRLEARRPVIFTIIGESGSGKSTLECMILAITPPSAGTIRFRGDDVTAMRSSTARLAFDEPVSIVDASLRMSIVNFFRSLRDTLGISIIYITHDLATACYISDEIMIMEKGCVVAAPGT